MRHNTYNLVFLLTFLIMACQTNEANSTQSNQIHEEKRIEADSLIHLTAETIEDDEYWLTKPDTISSDSLARLQNRYAKIKSGIISRRNDYLRRYQEAGSDSLKDEILTEAGIYLSLVLVEDVFPAWYGTAWDFDGYSNRPRDGVIACGYFVSTPLKHAGAPLNRYRIAQQYSLKIVELLCDRPTRHQKLEKMLSYVRNQPDDLYVVGLDNHVGYIYKSGEDISFIHSNYASSVTVMSEVAEESPVLSWSSLYVLGHLTSNKDFIRKWLTGEKIVVK